jgi:hypothetical protein
MSAAREPSASRQAGISSWGVAFGAGVPIRTALALAGRTRKIVDGLPGESPD